MKRISIFCFLVMTVLLGLRPLAQAQSCAAPTNVSVNSTGAPGNTTATVSFTASATALNYTVRYFWVGDSTAAGMMSVTTTTSPVTLTGLRPGPNAYYRVRVISNCQGAGAAYTASSSWVSFLVGGSGGPSGSCAAPTNVIVSSLTTSTAAVSFTPSATAISYTVRYYWAYDSTAAGMVSVNTTTSPVTVTGLRSQTAYRVSVVSNCAGGTTTSSPWTTFQTNGGGTAGCGAVTNLVNSASTPSTSTVSFTPVPGALSYTVRYHLYGDTINIGTTAITGSPVVFAGLTAGSFYGFTIVAHCANGPSAPAAGYFSTQYVAPGCGSISNVSTTTTTSSATLSFTPVPGVASYSIQYRAVNSSVVYSQSATTSPIVVSGLRPGTSYTAEVFSNCSTGGLQSPPVTVNFTTASLNNCGAVTNVVVTGTSATTATVSFTPGAGNTSFHVTYHLLNDSTRWVDTNASPATLTGLVPGQTYYIQVTSVCGSGGSTTYTGGGSIVFNFRGALAARNGLAAGLVSIFPNPAHRTASLVLPAVPGATQARLLLLNNVGQQVRAQTVPLAAGETRSQLDLTDLVPGLYTLRVLAGGQAVSQRLVVE